MQNFDLLTMFVSFPIATAVYSKLGTVEAVGFTCVNYPELVRGHFNSSSGVGDTIGTVVQRKRERICEQGSRGIMDVLVTNNAVTCC